MIGTIGGIVVIVSDQQKAVEFYSQKLGFDIKTDMSFVGIRWIEVAPKDSQSTISLMLPNVQMMSNEGVVEAAKKGIGTETGIWFYSDDMQSTYEELKNKGVDISQPEKQEWGGIMSKLKDQDGNSYSIVSSPIPENIPLDNKVKI
jgi:lactoylglutathione lyase